MTIDNEDTGISVEKDFDGVYSRAEIRNDVEAAMRNTFNMTWELKALLCGLEKVGY